MQYRALTVTEDGPTRLQPNALDATTVLVAGGAGAVGNAAIQLARWAGASRAREFGNSEFCFSREMASSLRSSQGGV